MNLSDFLYQLNTNWKSLLPTLILEAKKSFKSKVPVDFNNQSFLDKIPNTFGLYLFEVFPKNDFSKVYFLNNWKSYKDVNNIKCPTITSTFKDFDVNLRSEWNSFYIGKSENLRTRVKEHCFHELNCSTYSLKLKRRDELIDTCNFSLSYYDLKDIEPFLKNKEILQFVITNLERELRKEIKPWVGKQ